MNTREAFFYIPFAPGNGLIGVVHNSGALNITKNTGASEIFAGIRRNTLQVQRFTLTYFIET